MKPERQRTETCLSNYLNTSAYLPANSREPEFPEEQALRANCQEIVDLYRMLWQKQ
jgi:hypothetical protein